ncbi:MAG: chalcone isomerase family protein [Deltaproteobacteria bacterium]|nr:MAG: chalcone isomerase family protein [Deltaproteobacteria bacterium]
MRKLLGRFALALAVAGLVIPPAGAAEIEGVRFADRVERSGEVLELSGVGLLRYRVLFKGYVAALYLASGARPDAALGDVARQLEIEYFWAIPADKFAWSTREGIARNVDPETFESLRERIEQFNAFYEDVEPGDRYTLTYVPGAGTELARNGEPRGVVPGADFAAAIFAIWLGDAPLDASLKRQLLATP